MKPSNQNETSGGGRAHERLQLGGLVLDLVARELMTPDRRLAGVRRQALDLLLLLGRHAGQVVSKDDAMRAVWPDVVVGEGSLTQAIADIRRALGDSGHRLVRNVARRGYMLVPDGLVTDGLLTAGLVTDGLASPVLAPDAPAPELPPLSIAVMPFAVERVDGQAQDHEWFADALHSDLIAELTRMQGGMVIARETCALYRSTAERPVDPRQMARELGVRHVVRGSLRYDGEQVRLNLALVNGENGFQNWTEMFVVERARLSAAIADLAMQITRLLHPELYRSVVQGRAALSPRGVSADDLAMRAIARWLNGVTRDNVNAALDLCEQAVALDADCVRAWAGLNFIGFHGVMNRWTPDRDAALRRIEAAAIQLERLEWDSHLTHQARVIGLFLKADWAALLRATTAWIKRPHPSAFAGHGMANLLNGNADEAVSALEKALRLSPRDALCAEWQYRMAMAHFMAQRYELACDWAQTAVLTNPAVAWPPIHAAALQRLGQADAAREALAAFAARHPQFAERHVAERLPGTNPRLAAARDQLIESLRALS